MVSHRYRLAGIHADCVRRGHPDQHTHDGNGHIDRTAADANAPPSSPTPRPTATSALLPRVGEQGSTLTLIVTLNAERDPVVTTATAIPKSGDRLVAFDLTLASIDYQAMIYSVTYVTLRDTEAHAYAPIFTSVVSPPLFSGSLEPRQSVRGWLSFAVPMDAKLATLIYDPPIGRTRITFDVTERIASPTAAP